MYQHNARMETIIDDFLLLSRLESEDYLPDEMVNVDVAKILKTLSADVERISGESGIALNYKPIPIYISISSEELKSLFFNIIINTVKYTPAKGRITVKWLKDDSRASCRI